MIPCNGVFEGGGVRGIGHVGAICGMENAGYRFVDVAGSSAGAVVAALLAAGYTCSELYEELLRLDYRKFKGRGFIDHFGVPGKAFSILLHLGIYDTNYLEKWMDELLLRKGMQCFGAIRCAGRRLKITASDLTDERLLIFPDALEDFGICPDDFHIARAVRMSVSIPVFFEPARMKDRKGREHIIVDGGLLSNYPMWIFDDDKSGRRRLTFGFCFDNPDETCMGFSGRPDIVEYLKSIVSTSLDAIDRSRFSDGDGRRTIRIPVTVDTGSGPRRISAVDFDIGKKESMALFENGKAAAERFLRGFRAFS